MSRAVELKITVRQDASEPMFGAGPSVFADLAGNAVLATTDVDAVDVVRVGEAVIGLLRAAVIDASDDAIAASDDDLDEHARNKGRLL